LIKNKPALFGNHSPLPAALDCRGIGCLLCCARSQRPKARLCYYENEPGRRSAAKLLTKDGARRIAVRLSDLLAALPRLIVNNMARGVYLIGSKLAERVSAVQIVDCAGNSASLRLKDYISQKIEPEYKTLPWQQDVAVLLSTNEKPKK
jgi:hypothetical protein